MNWTRRNWLHGVIGGLSISGLCTGRLMAQVANQPRCAGTVSDIHGMPIQGLIVELSDPSGGLASASTDQRGQYDLPAPQKGPFIVILREKQVNTRLFEIRQLTGGTNQMLSVTVDPSLSTFAAIYGSCQAVEGVGAWILEDPKRRRELLERITLAALNENLERLKKESGGLKLSDSQRSFLRDKGEFVGKLVSRLG
jgi:hypothetical protein